VYSIVKSTHLYSLACKLFSLWNNVDADFKDLIGGLTNFDPAKRLTVRGVVTYLSAARNRSHFRFKLRRHPYLHMNLSQGVKGPI
jgi:hypothetical protein